MEATPLVSIIIPTFNRAALIGETLESIRSQTYQNWECLIVDDGSTDATAQVVGNFTSTDSRFRYLHRPSDLPKGANACRNFGFDHSNGALINWFDSDDLMLPNKLRIQVGLLETNSDVPMCVCQTIVFEGSPQNQLGLRKPIRSDDPLNDYIVQKIKWLTQSPVIRKKFLLSNRLRFDESLYQSQEWDFFVRLLAVDSRYVATDEPLVLFRKHGQSISSGKPTPEKILSNLKARTKLFSLGDALSAAAFAEIRKTALMSYQSLLQNGFYRQAAALRNELCGEKFRFSSVSKIKIVLAYISYRVVKKGSVFLKAKKHFS